MDKARVRDFYHNLLVKACPIPHTIFADGAPSSVEQWQQHTMLLKQRIDESNRAKALKGKESKPASKQKSRPPA